MLGAPNKTMQDKVVRTFTEDELRQILYAGLEVLHPEWLGTQYAYRLNVTVHNLKKVDHVLTVYSKESHENERNSPS